MYYYLVASLPLLSFDTERAPSHEEFLENCRDLLSPPHYRLLAQASIADLDSGEPGCRTLELWRGWETSLRNELLRLRAKNLSREIKGPLSDPAATQTPQDLAREAFSQDSPLQAEEILDRGRWDYLDELEAGHYFDIDMILIYALRLQILKRRARFEEQAGMERFERLYQNIMSPVGEN